MTDGDLLISPTIQTGVPHPPINNRSLKLELLYISPSGLGLITFRTREWDIQIIPEQSGLYYVQSMMSKVQSACSSLCVPGG
jgi:hypothetical protein